MGDQTPLLTCYFDGIAHHSQKPNVPGSNPTDVPCQALRPRPPSSPKFPNFYCFFENW